jgi:hypothetical protein
MGTQRRNLGTNRLAFVWLACALIPRLSVPIVCTDCKQQGRSHDQWRIIVFEPCGIHNRLYMMDNPRDPDRNEYMNDLFYHLPQFLLFPISSQTIQLVPYSISSPSLLSHYLLLPSLLICFA